MKALLSESLLPSQRAVRREDTRRRLLAAARKLFRLRGVEQLSMEEMAAAASVSRATIYLYFAGKPALLAALLEEDWAAQVRLFELLNSIDFGNAEQLGGWALQVAEGMRKARDSFGIHWAALGQNPTLIIRHGQTVEAMARLRSAAARNLLTALDGGAVVNEIRA